MIKFNFVTSGNEHNPPVIFLHGFFGLAGDWQKIMTGLSDSYFCIALDMPGHGQTEFPDIPQDLFLNQFALQMETFLLDNKILYPWVVGYSMGGRLAMHLLFQKNNFYRGFVLESASPGIEDVRERSARLAYDLKLADELAVSDLEAFLKIWYEQPIFDTLRKTPDFPRLILKRINNKPDQLACALRAMTVGRQKSFWNEFAKITKPVLLIFGGLDTKYKAIGKRIASVCPSATLEIVAGAGHNVHFEQPGSYLRIVRKFLDRHT